MGESDHEAFGTGAGALVDEADLLLLQFVQGFVRVGHSKCNVVDTLAFVLDEFGDGAFRRRRLQKLNFGLANLEESSLHFLVSDLFDVVAFHPQDVFVIGDGGFQTFHGNAEMFDVGNVHIGLRFNV